MVGCFCHCHWGLQKLSNRKFIMKSLISIASSAFYTHNYVFHMSDGVLLESFLPCLPRRHTDVLHMSCKLLNDDFAAFKNKKKNFTTLHQHIYFLPPCASSSRLPWSFAASSHLDKPWNIKQTQTSGLAMLTSVACVRLLSAATWWWFIAAWIESIMLSRNTLGAEHTALMQRSC